MSRSEAGTVCRSATSSRASAVSCRRFLRSLPCKPSDASCHRLVPRHHRPSRPPVGPPLCSRSAAPAVRPSTRHATCLTAREQQPCRLTRGGPDGDIQAAVSGFLGNTGEIDERKMARPADKPCTFPHSDANERATKRGAALRSDAPGDTPDQIHRTGRSIGLCRIIPRTGCVPQRRAEEARMSTQKKRPPRKKRTPKDTPGGSVKLSPQVAE